MKCDKIVETKCANGHVQKRKCFEASPLKCKRCEIESQRDNEILKRDMELQDKRLREQVEYDMRIAELDMQIRKIREDAEDKKTAQERGQALEQKKHDLEGAKHEATRPSPTTNAGANDQKHSDPHQPDTNNQKVPAASTPPVRIVGASAEEWERQKRVEGEHNAALDDLMALSGLEEVKEKFLNIKTRIQTAARQGIDVKRERMGMVMLGNPGTGMFTMTLSETKVLIC